MIKKNPGWPVSSSGIIGHKDDGTGTEDKQGQNNSSEAEDQPGLHRLLPLIGQHHFNLFLHLKIAIGAESMAALSHNDP
jgi:hypothetical protein